MDTKNQNNTRIRVGYVVKYKVGELEKITRNGRSRRMRIEVAVYAHDVAAEKKLLLKLENGQKKEIISSLLVF